MFSFFFKKSIQDIQYQHKITMDNFLEDLRGLLLPNDTRAVELNQAIYAFTERLKMTDSK